MDFFVFIEIMFVKPVTFAVRPALPLKIFLSLFNYSPLPTNAIVCISSSCLALTPFTSF